MRNILKLSSLVFILLLLGSCEEEQPPTPPDPNLNIWSGAKITFTKADDTNPEDTANQDKLTDNVIITRGTSGGQIYNIVTEDTFDKAQSPAGTEWAVGKIEDVSSLNFQFFRTAVNKPQDVVGKDLVLHLIEDDIYLEVKFTSWSAGKKGGFSYERSSPN
ncbi:MAG: hypothetical protein AAGD28_25305 [Bacteroidota bacterium]